MKVRRFSAAAAAAVVALGLAACGDSGGGESGSGGGGFEVGIKFDQPGLGLKEGSDYTGLDVDVAKYVAGAQPCRGTSSSCRLPAPSGALIETGQVNAVVATYSITDAHQGEGLASPAHASSPARTSGPLRRDHYHRSRDAPAGELCSVKGSTSAQGSRPSAGRPARSSAPTPSAWRPSCPRALTP